MGSFDLLPDKLYLLSPQTSEVKRSLSVWSQSQAKRWFDIGCVLFSLPFSIPILLLVGAAVRLSSGGPVLFRQQRVGHNGRLFTILKFRTMPEILEADGRPDVTTTSNQQFTPVGRFLRRWKLDELPQIFNVLRGDMSLIGPRPKLANHQISPLLCRPGITGQATLVFAREESLLADIHHSALDGFYRDVVLPLKQSLDDEYMAAATLTSDLILLVKSAFRR